jgi:hypothetical protein
MVNQNARWYAGGCHERDKIGRYDCVGPQDASARTGSGQKHALAGTLQWSSGLPTVAGDLLVMAPARVFHTRERTRVRQASTRKLGSGIEAMRGG